MKKTLIALASVAALGAAHADVTLYGVIDIGVASMSAGTSTDVNNPSNMNIFPSTGSDAFTKASNRTTSMTNGMAQPSRWGLKGTEDLGGGLKGNFVLESGLNIAGGNNPNDHALLATATGTANGAQYGAGDSSLNGQMFDREASIGLSGDFGSIQGGFQLSLIGEINGVNDPFNGGYISPFGTYGGLTGMGSSYSGRASNSFKYKYTMGNTQIGAFYALGGSAGNMGAGAQTGVQVIMQATPQLSVNLTAERMNDNIAFASASSATYTTAAAAAAGTGTATYPAALGATYYNSTQMVLGVNYQATSALKVNAGYLNIVQSNPSNGTQDLLNNALLGVPIANSAVNTSPYTTNLTTTLGWIGGTYDQSNTDHIKLGLYQRNFSAYTLGYSANNANAASYGSGKVYGASNQQIIAIGYYHDLSKKTDVYLNANYNKYDSAGVAAATNGGSGGAASQWGNVAGMGISLVGAGLRMKF
jgi:predicted porin